MSTFLENILEQKRRRVEATKASPSSSHLKKRAVRLRSSAVPRRLSAALSNRARSNVIAEFKRASPSKGAIARDRDLGQILNAYEVGGACAVSILTEQDFFKGSIDDLHFARGRTSLPILQKDFIIDEFQIFEAAAAGADAVLLIAAALEMPELESMWRTAHEIGMDAVVEVHNSSELNAVTDLPCKIIGINNRNLQSFKVSLDVSRSLARLRPQNVLMIAESGISECADIDELRGLGFDGFLIGEALMRSGDPQRLLSSLVGSEVGK